MNIGDKIALHKVYFPHHIDAGIDEFRLITITEKRDDVPFCFGKGTGDGYKAKDEQDRYYIMHWDSFPDDSMNPNVTWMEVTSDYKNYIQSWIDITETFMAPKLPDFFKDKDVLGYCPTHMELFYLHGNNLSEITNGGCWHCYLAKQFPNKPDTHLELIKKIQEENKTFKGW